MDTTGSSFTARNNAKRAAEKMIANGKAPAVDYSIRPRDDGRFEIVWKTVPTTGEVETEIATTAIAAEDGHYSTNPLLSVNENPSDAPPNAGAEEAAAATGHEPAASSVPASGAPERDNKWPDGTRVMVRNKPRSWSEATIYTRLDAEYWRVQYPSGGEQRRIARAVGRIENRYKLAKLFDITVGEDGFTFGRNPARITDEARLDGFYVIRTSVEDKALAADNVVGAYKSLARVERAFRSLKTVDLHLRPIHHWLAPRVRAHVFLCMLACHVEWHMRERLKPLLFDDDDLTAAARERASIVAPAQPSPAALRKRASKLTANGGPVHSFQTLLRDLATCTLNEMTTTLNAAYSFTLVATPTPIQAQAFRLLAVDPTRL